MPKVDSVPDLFQLIRRIEISVVSSDWKRQAGTGELVECSRVSDQRARLNTGMGLIPGVARDFSPRVTF